MIQSSLPVDLDSKIAEDENALLTEKTQKKRLVVVHTENCKACGLCIAHCPRKALSRGTHINSMGYEATVANLELCSGCGLCFYSCPEPDAISVE